MKLLKLDIKNIASIEKATIDFENDPLASSEVFLITGKTGSGKTTILDAICLALYNNTPRLKNTQMKGDVPNEVDLKINNPEQLMRRNTCMACITLTFLGNDGQHYEAKWSVARAYMRQDGRIQDVQWSLTNLDTGTLINNKKELPKIFSQPSIIGLDFEQFCRTTMLAQGEFTKFLNSQDKEKSAILGKIIGADNYMKIGAKTFAITSEKKKDWEQAKQRIADIKVLTDEEINQLNEQKAKLDKQHKIEIKLLESIKGKLQWLKNDVELREETANAKKALDEATEQSNCDENKKLEALVNEWNATIDARNWLITKNRASQEISTFNKELDNLIKKFMVVKDGMSWLEDDIEKKKNELNATQQFLNEQKEKKDVYANEQTISAHLNSIVKCLNDINQEQENINTANAKLDGPLKTQLEEAQTKHDEKVTEVEKSRELLGKLEEELTKLNLPELRKSKEDLTSIINNADTALLRIESLNKARGDVNSVQNAINGIKQQLGELNKTLKQQENETTKAQEEYDNEKALCDKLRESVEQWSKTIRGKLKKGDICPVCQQEVNHAVPHEDVLDGIFAQAQEKLNDFESKLTSKKDAYNVTKANINAQLSLVEVKKKELDNANKQLDIEISITLDACKKCGITVVDDNTSQLLEQLKSKNDQLLENVKQQVADAEVIESKRNTQNATTIKQQQQLTQASKTLNDINNEINNCKANIQSSNKIIGNLQNEITSHRNEVAKVVNATQWTNDWMTEPLLFVDELNQAAQLFKQHTENELLQTNAIKSATNDLNNVKSTVNTIVNAMPQWSNVSAACKREASDLLKDANSLNTSIKFLKATIAQSQKTVDEMTDNLNKWLNENPSFSIESLTSLSRHSQSEVEDAQNVIKILHDKLLRLDEAYKGSNNRLNKHIEEKPKFNDDETQESLTKDSISAEESVNSLREEIGGIKEKLENDTKQKEELGELIKDCDNKKIIYDKWECLNDLIGDSTGNKFRTIALSYILENLIQSANVYMTSLTSRYRLEVQPGTFVISVIDAYQGYTSRTANTISGGESFLVSLALALALSDIAQQLQVDMLFIDEGFGTLSGEPLQNAINTLRSLHTATGRQVGIISHIEELKERIPVQIQVNQEGNSSSSTVEVVSL